MLRYKSEFVFLFQQFFLHARKHGAVLVTIHQQPQNATRMLHHNATFPKKNVSELLRTLISFCNSLNFFSVD